MAELLRMILIAFNYFTDWLLELFFGWFWGAKQQVDAPKSQELRDIVTKSVTELASSIRVRKLTSYDVVLAYIERMRQVNQQLNALADGPFEEALDQAKAIDKRLAAGDYSDEDFRRQPLLGVPFTTKDSTAVRGKLHTLGLLARRNTRATEDAECVRLLKAAGAIVIATSNVPEVNKWIETRSTLFGQTNNPYDLRRSAGGSSGGEASLTSACCTAFGLGTDIGGSVRIPAFNCGIFGHKPSNNVINVRGTTLRKGTELHTMVGIGPLVRNACDLLPLFELLVEPTALHKLKLHTPVDLRKLRYFYMPTLDVSSCNTVTAQTQAAMAKACHHFESLTGQPVALAKLPGSELAPRLWRYWMTQEPANFATLLGNGQPPNLLGELVRKLCGTSDYTLAAIYSLIDGILPKERERLMRDVTDKCKTYLRDLLGDNGVLFFHSSPRTAPYHYYPLLRFSDFAYFSIFNVLRVPATQVPLGLSSNGLPLGLQVIANDQNDRYCFAVAEELERAFGGWVPPF